MRFACWITKVADTHPEYVILVFARQLWLHERAPMLLFYAQRVACSYWKLVQYLAVMLGIVQQGRQTL